MVLTPQAPDRNGRRIAIRPRPLRWRPGVARFVNRKQTYRHEIQSGLVTEQLT